MATTQAVRTVTIPAGSDLSTKQFLFMNISSGKLALASAGGRVAGVLANKPDADGKAGELQISGIVKVIAGDTVTSGGSVASDSAGKAVPATGANNVVGIAIDTVAVGESVRILLTGTSAVALAAGEETVTSGALSTSIGTTYLSVTGTQAYTLAAGETIGARKVIECTVAATTPLGTLTIADCYGSESLVHVFTAVGQRLVLEWRTGGWKIVEKVRAGTQVAVLATTVLTGYDMALLYDCQVTATVVSSSTKGIPDGTLPGERIYIGCSVAASTPIGSITFTGSTLAGAAVTDLQAIGATTDTVTLEWTGAKWLVVANSGITVA